MASAVSILFNEGTDRQPRKSAVSPRQLAPLSYKIRTMTRQSNSWITCNSAEASRLDVRTKKK
jgi:hypothetical protein